MSSPVQISVVIPCLNEEEAVGAVVDQAWEGIRRSGATGEVIVVDNGSTDGSAEVAAEHGPGSSASRDAATAAPTSPGSPMPAGDYVVMADADGRIRLQELGPFVDAARAGRRPRPRLALRRDRSTATRCRGSTGGSAIRSSPGS